MVKEKVKKKELAKLLNTSRQTIHRLINSGMMKVEEEWGGILLPKKFRKRFITHKPMLVSRLNDIAFGDIKDDEVDFKNQEAILDTLFGMPIIWVKRKMIEEDEE